MDIGEGLPDMPEEKLWSYRIGDLITDSVPESKLKELIATGQLSDDTPVLAPGDTIWENVGAIKLLMQGYELKPHPWYRFFARIFDIMIFSFIVTFLLGMASVFIPSLNALLSGTGMLCLLQMILICLWIIPETFFMATFGTTPSKFIFNIKVRNSSGRILGFGESFSRSMGATIKGLAAGIPLVYLITMAMAYDKLEKNGITTWDSEGHFKVYHGKIGIIRAGAILVLVCIYLFLRVIAVLL